MKTAVERFEKKMLVEFLKLVRISLKNKNKSHVWTLHILFMIHILQLFLWVIARKVGT